MAYSNEYVQTWEQGLDDEHAFDMPDVVQYHGGGEWGRVCACRSFHEGEWGDIVQTMGAKAPFMEHVRLLALYTVRATLLEHRDPHLALVRQGLTEQYEDYAHHFRTKIHHHQAKIDALLTPLRAELGDGILQEMRSKYDETVGEIIGGSYDMEGLVNMPGFIQQGPPTLN